jgi:hypothetical protein
VRPFPATDRSFGPIAAGEDVRINLPGDQNSSKRHDERCRVREVEVDCLGVLFEGALLSSIQRMAVTTSLDPHGARSAHAITRRKIMVEYSLVLTSG